MLPGSDPALADEYVLLMAHLDHLGIREPRPGDAADADRIHNGAMDNATGVATLIEVARQFSRPGNRPRRPILFAAVTAEEKGLLGAEYLARHPVVDGRVVAVVNLDMPILTYDFQDVIAFGAEHSTSGPIVRAGGGADGRRGSSPDPLPEEGPVHPLRPLQVRPRGRAVGLPDDRLRRRGRRASPASSTDAYHSPRDDLSQPFNWQAGARFAQLNYLIAREIADGAEAPLWYADSFFGDAFGGDQPRAQRPAR